MAGGHHNKVALDPAIVRLANMTSNRHKYFRWTPKTAGVTVLFVGIIPSIFGYMAYTTENKWDLRAKRRGDLISEF